MVKKILLILLVILTSSFAFAIEEYEVGGDAPPTDLEKAQEEIQRTNYIVSKLDEINKKLINIPDKGAYEENFKQMDQRFQDFFNQQTSFFVGILFLDNLLILAGLLLLRSKGLI